jgi:hypothetical protein
MARFTLEIDLDNDAWRDEDGDIDHLMLMRALQAVADRTWDRSGSIKDDNGNTSGSWAIKEDN